MTTQNNASTHDQISSTSTAAHKACCSPRIALVLLIATTVVALDQFTKRLALASFQPGEVRQIIAGFFNLTLSFNRGAAFGLWSSLQSGWREVVLGGTILLALGVVGFLLTRPYYRSYAAQIALAAILGGAIGNVIDRFIFGAVIDFLDFYVGSYHWPAFNIADSAICVGVGLLLMVPRGEGVAVLPPATKKH
jgi:signal peptidase II